MMPYSKVRAIMGVRACAVRLAASLFDLTPFPGRTSPYYHMQEPIEPKKGSRAAAPLLLQPMVGLVGHSKHTNRWQGICIP